jgi:hypothetical protein
MTEVAPSSLLDATSSPMLGLTGFFKRLAQYYAEFLSTDFKKQRLPKRRLETVDAAGRLTGIPLRKYPGFEQKLWSELTEAVGTGISLTIARGTWRSALPRSVAQAIETHIAGVSAAQLDAVVLDCLKMARKLADDQAADPELAFERFIEEVRASVARHVIGPLLNQLEGFFSRTEHKPVESLHELEDQLSARLSNSIEVAAGSAFSALLVERDAAPLESVLRDQLERGVICSELTEFFTTFAAGDLYTDVSDLVRSSRLLENADFYLHIGEVHHGGHVYPIFYIPFAAERTERGFAVDSEPRLYVNKRAMDYVAQEVARSESRASVPSVITDRVFYLAPSQSPVGVAQVLLDEIAAGFNLRAGVDLREPHDQKAASMFVTATNRLSFSLFDRSDESMVNDYEALLAGLEAGSDVVTFFKQLIDDFLLSNPVSVRRDVDDAWDDTPMPQRLVFDSPLPLVEEQRKILSAIQHPKARFIAVEGPPGTGKSHTITAVAFNVILAGKSLLVLSDKKEALDVVEDKLNQALAKVRPSEDFPNPILRLGRDSSNYAQLLKKSAMDRLRVNHRLVRQRRDERERALEQGRRDLLTGLEKAARVYADIDVADIAMIEQQRATIIGQDPKLGPFFEDRNLCELLERYAEVAAFVRGATTLAPLLRRQGTRPRRLLDLAHIATVLSQLELTAKDIEPIRSFSIDQLRNLESAIRKIEDAAMPVFGYLFAGNTLRQVHRSLRDECGIESPRPHKDIDRLTRLRAHLRKIEEHLAANDLQREYETGILLVLLGYTAAKGSLVAPQHILQAVMQLETAMERPPPLLAGADDRFYHALLEGEAGPLATVEKVAALLMRERAVQRQFERVPEIDYLGAKTKIESLNSQALADRIDERLISYYDNRKNDATALGKLIREKQKFPIEKFADLQSAFPCIIAGLRDYAEFVPLEREIFDLVIIDEASQVSIAQALPAIIRAKKVLVLGDRNQFGNVKTANASREIDAAYMKELLVAFGNDFPEAGAEVQTRVDLFNIRHSVLDFIEPISNFDIQLKKHFRSYPEMIGFSSKHFYEDTLQVMKIRGKPLADVIEFDAVAHDGRLDKRNINDIEARHIIGRIEQLLACEPPPSVGVITPHTEQQAYIAMLVHEHARSEEIYSTLRLKVMTFDTCQGEEREIIFYSLVATKEKDRLSYVFPKTLGSEAGQEEVDHSLRLQRLNVGFSRGQEKIVLVHSKALEDYRSALRTVLFHYRNELDRSQALPAIDDLDQASPMERKVLHWLSQVPFIRELGEACEVVAQFELGKYLRQLDPSYQHPDYRVDFLVRISDQDQLHQLVIEYDGFEFHFDRNVATAQINESSWRSYLTSADLEREKVLESFGVPMIRLNRFNLGKDPIATIDALLRKRLEATLNHHEPHELVSDVAEEAAVVEEGLKTGDYKRCSKCDRDLPVATFRVPGTKTGLARHCRDCRRRTAGPRFRRSGRRR